MPTLAEVMTEKVVTMEPSTTLAAAAEAMVGGRFGSVLVTQGSLLVGIFTERDALRATAAGRDPTEDTVESWMTRDPVTARPDTDTDEAVETMLAGGFRHLPVVEAPGRAAVGIVSLRDLLATRIGRRR